MDILFNRFSLTPSIDLNGHAGAKERHGVLLMGRLGEDIGFAEYFPHHELGDPDCDEFLSTFKDQKLLSQKKAFYFLDPKWITTDQNSYFLNHQLHTPNSTDEASFFKYKIKNREDIGFIDLLRKGYRLRLDANGIFDQKSWTSFKDRIPEKLLTNIEYIEDPLIDEDWSIVSLPKARDFITGSPYEFKIYKPYREFFMPANDHHTIFSGNMGLGLANYQGYLELTAFGNLLLTHGLLTPALYSEDYDVFRGNYTLGFSPDREKLLRLLNHLHALHWRSLCKL